MIGIIIFGVLGYYLAKYIIKYEVILYIVALALSAVAIALGNEGLVPSGVSVGFILIVMFAGALPKQWTLTKRWMSLRRPYAIIGVLLISSHAVIMFFDDFRLFGLLAYAVMVPLMITSFRVVRKKLGTKNWKMLHKLAYVAYAFLLVHMIMIGEYVYIVLYLVYIVFKIIKVRKQIELKKARAV